MLISICLNTVPRVNAQVPIKLSAKDKERLLKILSLIGEYSHLLSQISKFDRLEHCNPLCRSRERRLVQQARDLKDELETRYKVTQLERKVKLYREKMAYKKRAKPLG